ncbi:hypothetical protein J4407_01585 [Candidatus Pacearchaeota archaeon]|nr:hypothetical protein [Candidatus Pacearchaeota archaeon]
MKRWFGKEMKIQSNFSNRAMYSFLSIFILVLVSAIIFAYGTSTPSSFGHSFSELAPPTNCGTNQVPQWTGSSWGCTPAGGGGVIEGDTIILGDTYTVINISSSNSTGETINLGDENTEITNIYGDTINNGDENTIINNILGDTVNIGGEDSIVNIDGDIIRLGDEFTILDLAGVINIVNGKVGIKTTNPTEVLDVVGNIKFSGSLIGNIPATSITGEIPAENVESGIVSYGEGIYIACSGAQQNNCKNSNYAYIADPNTPCITTLNYFRYQGDAAYADCRYDPTYGVMWTEVSEAGAVCAYVCFNGVI